MKMIRYISAAAMPIVILIIIGYGILEKNKVYDTFLIGVKEGAKIVIKLFPTLLGIFVAVGALRSSGILDLMIQIISPITNFLKIPMEIMPLAMIRPISGSASMAVDSTIGLITSTIMGSTETTFYTIAVYTSAVGIKKIRFVLKVALLADLVGILTSIFIYSIL